MKDGVLMIIHIYAKASIKKYLKLYGHCDAKVALDEDKLAQAAI